MFTPSLYSKSTIINLLRTKTKYFSTSTTRKSLEKPTVTILNAYTKIGQHLALLLKQSPQVEELRLYDAKREIFAIGEDISHIDTKTVIKSYGGKQFLRDAIENVDLVVQIGGCRTKNPMSDAELFEKNVDNVRLATNYLIEFNPKAIFCIATPPIECMVPMISEEYKRCGVYDPRKIIGITSIASMRTNHFVGLLAGKDPTNILTPIVGGIGPNSIVSVLSQVKPHLDLAGSQSQLVQRSVSHAEENVLKCGTESDTLCLSPAVGISRFVNSMLKAIAGDTNCVDCAFVKQTGHMENFLSYMTSIVRLGRHGILSTHMPKIDDREAYLLKKARIFIKSNISLGESFITGEQTYNKIREEICEPKKNPCEAKPKKVVKTKKCAEVCA